MVLLKFYSTLSWNHGLQSWCWISANRTIRNQAMIWGTILKSVGTKFNSSRNFLTLDYLEWCFLNSRRILLNFFQKDKEMTYFTKIQWREFTPTCYTFGLNARGLCLNGLYQSYPGRDIRKIRKKRECHYVTALVAHVKMLICNPVCLEGRITIMRHYPFLVC